jgi:hypothetical protein
VQELVEAVEMFRAVRPMLLRANTATAEEGTAPEASTAAEEAERAAGRTVYDLACGNGLVGILVAHCFPLQQVRAEQSLSLARCALGTLSHLLLVPLAPSLGPSRTFSWSLSHLLLVPLAPSLGASRTFSWSLSHLLLVPLAPSLGASRTFSWSLSHLLLAQPLTDVLSGRWCAWTSSTASPSTHSFR